MGAVNLIMKANGRVVCLECCHSEVSRVHDGSVVFVLIDKAVGVVGKV